MYTLFKNRLIQENCFHVSYGAKRLKQTNSVLNLKGSQGASVIQEVTLSFVRERTFEEEFFLIVESKAFNAQTGQKDRCLIAVDDIDEIEHTEGL